MLVGFALRDLGPWLFGSAREEQVLPEFEGAKSTIRKQTLSSIGNAISVGGAGIAVVTFAALLAKTDDDLGSIVVGMSLVLATVGVAAWTYDVFRRYRTAMEIVSAQEHAVRERLAPRGKRRRPQPAPADRAEGQLAVADTPEPTPGDADNLPLVADQVTSELESLREVETASDQEAAHDLDAVEPISDIEEEDSLPPAPRVEQQRAEPARTGENETAPAPRLAPSADDQAAVKNPAVSNRPGDEERVELPPLPFEADDALIDESVRFSTRAEPKRTVPSWLFEDLENDLATHNPSKQDDPVDQFQEAKPFARSSALDRLLSDDPASDSEQSTGEPSRPSGGRPSDRDKR